MSSLSACGRSAPRGAAVSESSIICGCDRQCRLLHGRNTRLGSLPDNAAYLVAMPIVQSAEDLDKWLNKRRGRVPELGSDTELYRRIESQQPYRSPAIVTAVSADFARFTGPIELHGVHPLTLIQGYSNTDKHRAVRLAVGRTLESQSVPAARRVEHGTNWRPLEPGSLLAEGIDPRPSPVDLQTAVFVQRPDSAVWVPPAKELKQIHHYVADVLVPILVTGGPISPALPRQIRLDDTGESAEERTKAGDHETADERLAEEAFRELAALYATPRQWLPPPTRD